MSDTKLSLVARARGWFADAKANPRFRFGMLGAGAVILVDQASKF